MRLFLTLAVLFFGSNILAQTGKSITGKSCGPLLGGRESIIIDFAQMNTKEEFEDALFGRINYSDLRARLQKLLEEPYLFQFSDARHRQLRRPILVIPTSSGYAVDFQDGRTIFIPYEDLD